MGYKQSGDTISPYNGFKMVCYTNSVAHVYAKKYGVNYTLICNHQYETVTNKATISNDGQTYKKCATCGDVTDKTVIAKVSNITLSKNSYSHNGKVQKPAVIVKDSKGKMLENGTDYTANAGGIAGTLANSTIAGCTVKAKNIYGHNASSPSLIGVSGIAAYVVGVSSVSDCKAYATLIRNSTVLGLSLIHI